MDRSCHIFIVEDQPIPRQKLTDAFRPIDDNVAAAGSMHEFKLKLPVGSAVPDVLILDAMFPDKDGSRDKFQVDEVITHLRSVCSESGASWPAIILVSGQNEPARRFAEVIAWLEDRTIRDVLPKSAANLGWDFFTMILLQKVERIRSEQRHRHVISSFEDAVASLQRVGIVTTDPDLAGRLWGQINQAAQLRHNVYIYGEKGTGKELVAKAISEVLGRDKGIHALNCAEIPANLFESEIFGHVGGAATDITRDRAGAIEAAGNGVLFLDEITKLAPDHSTKLLRPMEPSTRKYKKMGSDTTLDVKCMFVTAAQDPILKAVAKGFSAELADRITEIEIRLPPLRERRGDIPSLINFFWGKYCRSAGLRLDDDLTRRLSIGRWPGNVRQLEKFLKRLAGVTWDHKTSSITLEDAVRLLPPNPEEDIGSVMAELAAPVSTADQGAYPSLVELISQPDNLKIRLRAELAYGKPPTWHELVQWRDESASETAILKVLQSLLSDVLGIRRLSTLQEQHRLVQRPTQRSKLDEIVLTNNPAKIQLYCAIAYLALSPKESQTITNKRLSEITGLGEAQAWNVLTPLAGGPFHKDDSVRSKGRAVEQTGEAGGHVSADEKDWQFIYLNPEKKDGKRHVYSLCEGLLK